MAECAMQDLGYFTKGYYGITPGFIDGQKDIMHFAHHLCVFMNFCFEQMPNRPIVEAG
jgi:hypothetical protein